MVSPDLPPSELPPDLPSEADERPHDELAYGELAAGELGADAAAALRAHLAADPGAAARFEEARTVERLLRAEPLLPLPLSLVGRILTTTVPGWAPRRARPHVVLARVAACVLVTLASWVALAGELPAMADMVTPHARLVASLEDVAVFEGDGLPRPPAVGHVFDASQRAADESDPAETLALTLIGLLLLAGGTAYVLLSHQAAARASRAGEKA